MGERVMRLCDSLFSPQDRMSDKSGQWSASDRPSNCVANLTQPYCPCNKGFRGTRQPGTTNPGRRVGRCVAYRSEFAHQARNVLFLFCFDREHQRPMVGNAAPFRQYEAGRSAVIAYLSSGPVGDVCGILA